MKIDIGTDIVSVERIRRAYEKFGERFYARFLSAEERKTIRRPETAAGFWAAKEAAAKALGCGIGKELAFSDIVVSKTKRGAPVLDFDPEVKKRFHIRSCSLSISHDGGFTVAVVALVRTTT
jgi:holo-[acyl-carrier protein] synthase